MTLLLFSIILFYIFYVYVARRLRHYLLYCPLFLIPYYMTSVENITSFPVFVENGFVLLYSLPQWTDSKNRVRVHYVIAGVSDSTVSGVLTRQGVLLQRC